MSPTTANAADAQAWSPKFPLALSTARSKAFDDNVEAFSRGWNADDPLPPALTTGWHLITPEIAEGLLRRNPRGGNRKANLATVLYYENQMRSGEWPETGQPIILTAAGKLLDGQHRLWACYLGNVPFHTFVVADVPERENLFAYIDNSKARSPAAAVFTAGLNGVSPLTVRIVDMDYSYSQHLFTPTSAGKHGRLAPIHYVREVKHRQGLREAARLAISDYETASELLGKEVVGFATLKITEIWGEDTADRFFQEIGSASDDDDTSTIGSLVKLMQKDQRKVKNQMKAHQRLGNLILAFNCWITGDTLRRRWELQVHQDYPVFEEPDPAEVAAAEANAAEAAEAEAVETETAEVEPAI